MSQMFNNTSLKSVITQHEAQSTGMRLWFMQRRWTKELHSDIYLPFMWVCIRFRHKNKVTLWTFCLWGKEYYLGTMALWALCVFSSGRGATPAFFISHSVQIQRPRSSLLCPEVIETQPVPARHCSGFTCTCPLVPLQDPGLQEVEGVMPKYKFRFSKPSKFSISKHSYSLKSSGFQILQNSWLPNISSFCFILNIYKHNHKYCIFPNT